MEFSKLLIITFFTVFQCTLLFPAVLSIESAVSTKTSVFRTYIGAGFKNVEFSDVPISPDVEFHFMLAFAVDCTALFPSPTDGIFNVFWDKETLTPEEVSAIKAKNSNVKVILSIGGDSCGNHTVKFNATSIDSWVSNAVPSITKIIIDYNLDGIDIDYEQFIAEPNTFSECMGQLVTQLKQNGTISIASIAPYDDEDVQNHYEALWKNYSLVFDYVNFQFYAYDKGTSFSLFMEYFDTQSSIYEGANMVAGFATDATAGGLSTGDGFFDACKKLKSHGKLAGIFVWSADDSKAAGFSFENQAQTVLAGSGGIISTVRLHH